jgi:hypothetical protein
MDTSMNIVMNEIDNITLNYFANKSQYDSILRKTEHVSNKQYNSDVKFYKKRILDLTKRLFRSDEEKLLDTQLTKCFTNYVKSCINYMKFLDKSDIIQQKYESEHNRLRFIDTSMVQHYSKIEMEDNKEQKHRTDATNDINKKNIDSNIKYDHLFSRVEEVKKVTLDNFVIKTNETINPKILPKKEEINIKTKEHKRKGIIKKKNIKNIYEDSKNEAK